MTQKDKRIFQYKESIADTLEKIVDRLNSYEMLDATLSENTLMMVNAYLIAADNALESGFVKDACEEIEEYFKENSL